MEIKKKKQGKKGRWIQRDDEAIWDRQWLVVSDLAGLDWMAIWFAIRAGVRRFPLRPAAAHRIIVVCIQETNVTRFHPLPADTAHKRSRSPGQPASGIAHRIVNNKEKKTPKRERKKAKKKKKERKKREKGVDGRPPRLRTKGGRRYEQ